jgi:hypothetical protein
MLPLKKKTEPLLLKDDEIDDFGGKVDVLD